MCQLVLEQTEAVLALLPSDALEAMAREAHGVRLRERAQAPRPSPALPAPAAAAAPFDGEEETPARRSALPLAPARGAATVVPPPRPDRALLVEAAARAFLFLMTDGRLCPTDWLNAGIDEPRLLMTVRVDDEARRFPALFRRRIEAAEARARETAVLMLPAAAAGTGAAGASSAIPAQRPLALASAASLGTVN